MSNQNSKLFWRKSSLPIWRRLLTGFGALVEGWRILRPSPKLWLLLIIPWLIDLLLIVWTWGLAIAKLPTLIASVLTGFLSPDSWTYAFLYYPAWVLLVVGAMVASVFLVVSLATLVAAPFFSLMVETHMLESGAPLPGSRNLRKRLVFVLRMGGVGITKSLLFSVLGVLIFLGQLIPGLNLIFAFAALMIIAADCFDYSFEALGWGLGSRLAEMAKLLPEIVGLSGALSLTLLVPGLTVFAVPLGILGAAQIQVRRLRGPS